MKSEYIFPWSMLPLLNDISNRLNENGRDVRVLERTVGGLSVLYIEEKTGCWPWNKNELLSNTPALGVKIYYDFNDKFLHKTIKELQNNYVFEIYPSDCLKKGSFFSWVSEKRL